MCSRSGSLSAVQVFASGCKGKHIPLCLVGTSLMLRRGAERAGLVAVPAAAPSVCEAGTAALTQRSSPLSPLEGV